MYYPTESHRSFFQRVWCHVLPRETVTGVIKTPSAINQMASRIGSTWQLWNIHCLDVSTVGFTGRKHQF